MSKENTMKVLRSCKRDNAQTSEKGLVASNCRSQAKMASRAANKAMYSDEFDITAAPKRREKQWTDWMDFWMGHISCTER